MSTDYFQQIEHMNVFDTIKFNIVKTLVDEGNTPKSIVNTLEKFKISECTAKQLEEYVHSHIGYSWNKGSNQWDYNKCQMFLFKYVGDDDYQTDNLPEISQENIKIDKCKTFKVNTNIKIPTIKELQLACTILDENEEINLTDDAGTLLKNMAQIKSKINEIAKAINKISKIICESNAK